MTIALSLVAHTNVGKTTLARTLLRRDIGEVRDEAHVTLVAERQTLVEAPDGARLELWDTPGFGDSVRLARRLARGGNPIGWFLNEVWDRWREPALWSSQRAVQNVLDEADVVLYLVNASEAPEDSPQVDAELTVLDLLNRPALVLLNQTGPPRDAAAEGADLQRWQQGVAPHPCVRSVLALDAFARCWVQEDVLLQAVAAALPEARQPAFVPLHAAWRARERGVWQASMRVLAERLARAALDRERVTDSGWSARLVELGAALGLRRGGAATPRERAMSALAERLDADVRATTDRLIALHGLDGQAAARVLGRLAEHYAVREPLGEGKAAVVGGLVSGALAGLKADLATGGLTLGGGLLAGGLLGALGAAGLARGYNLVRGVEQPTLAWTDEVLGELTEAALLGYLAVAHHGRGRGAWVESEQPAFWAPRVHEALAPQRAALAAAWSSRGASRPTGELAAALEEPLHRACADLLRGLYPEAAALLDA
jgi:hypothetical protein